MSRIANLPRRDWVKEATPELIREMTNICRAPNGTMVLRASQAITLYEAATLGGVFAAIRTGGGKTIVSGLLPYVLGAENPILFVPAKLKKKTRIEFAQLRQHWKIPKNYRIESYEKLGQKQHEKMLDNNQHDLVVCDEAQLLKHVKSSARARRMAKHKRAYNPPMCCLSGTPGEVDEFAHLLWWCLGSGAPVPSEEEELAVWAGCLNAKVDEWARTDPAELVPHLGPEAADYPKKAFRDRLVSTPGIIVSVDTYEGSRLIVRPRYVEPEKATEAAFADLRQVLEMPDGWSLADAAFEGWAAARQLGLGYYYMHDPRPPEPFRDVRKHYCKFVRTVLEYSERYDSELQVREALASGHLLSPQWTPSAHLTPAHWEKARKYGIIGRTIWDAWQIMQPEYTPKRYPVWLSDAVIDSAIAWGRAAGAQQQGGIIWVDSVAFGNRLVEKTGWPYFRNMGLDQNKRFIESDAVGSKETIIASIESNKEGRNLQGKWHRNLIIDLPTQGDDMQQLVSRTHRDGQNSTNVFVDYMVPCYEYYNAMFGVIERNQSDFQNWSQRYRLLDADVVMPTLKGRKGEFAWQRAEKKKKSTAPVTIN